MEDPRSPLPYASVQPRASRAWLIWLVLGIVVLAGLGIALFMVMLYMVAAPAIKTVAPPPPAAPPAVQPATVPSTTPAP